MPDVIHIASPQGVLALRPERDDDRAFRYRLFCDSRLPEWYQVTIEPSLRERLMQHQYEAQTQTYRSRFPAARFDIIELAGEPIGRIVVNRPGGLLHLVDHAIVPQRRNKGIGSAVMRALMEEAKAAGIPFRLKVASGNDPSMQLYLRLGFVLIDEVPAYIEMEWPAPERLGPRQAGKRAC
jgi:ribosomal protein S18 acetylase RimI-like enzyme